MKHLAILIILLGLLGRQATIGSEPGWTELNFSQFFVTPVGPAGLVMTDTLRALDGKRVRIAGYIVQQEKSLPGMLLLTPMPVRLHEDHYGLADDLPASTVHLFSSDNFQGVALSSNKPVVFTGILSLGNREEADGRISVVRVTLNPARAHLRSSAAGKGAPRLTTKTFNKSP
jgi:hypothetical protein